MKGCLEIHGIAALPSVARDDVYMAYDIITIGSATRDVFMTSTALHPHRAPDVATHIEACFPFGAKIGVDEIYFSTGGGATNSAITFSRLGKMHAAAVCRIAEDSAGKEVLDALHKDHVGTELVQVVEGHTHKEHTGYSTILSPGGDIGERSILVYRGASEKIEHEKILWRKLHAKWFYVTSLGGDFALLKKILVHAKSIGARVAFNPGRQELDAKKLRNVIASGAKQSREEKNALKPLDILILNREEAAKLTGEKLENTKGLLRALASFAPLVLMTDGSKGAYAIVKSQITNHKSQKTEAYYIPSVGHKPKNLTGAGDAFGSGFLVGWMKSGGDIIEALRVGSFNADSVVQNVGAKRGILDAYPSQKQIVSLSVKKIKV